MRRISCTSRTGKRGRGDREKMNVLDVRELMTNQKYTFHKREREGDYSSLNIILPLISFHSNSAQLVNKMQFVSLIYSTICI